MMATFFGEVLSVYSRAVEDDEEDQDNSNEEDEQIRKEIEEKRWAVATVASLTYKLTKLIKLELG